MTGVLVDLVLRLLHEQHGRPGLRVSLGIVDGHFVPERIGVAACESLGQTPARAQSGPPVGGVSAEIGGFNDQRVTFPTAARVTKPLTNIAREMRTVADRNHSGIVPHLHVDRDVLGRLHDLVIVVVPGSHHRDAARNAPKAHSDVFRTVVRMQPTALGCRFPSLLRTIGQRRKSPVLGVGDERGSIVELAVHEPEMVVVAGGVGRFEFVVLAQCGEKDAVAEGSVRVSVEELSGVSFQVLDFLIGEKLAAFQLFWTFERRRRIMRPHAGQVDMAVRSARGSPRFCPGLRVRFPRLRGDGDDHQRDGDSNNESTENPHTSMIHLSLRLVPVRLFRTAAIGIDPLM